MPNHEPDLLAARSACSARLLFEMTRSEAFTFGGASQSR